MNSLIDTNKIVNTEISFLNKVVIANILLIIGAKCSIPFHPVPLSLQTFAIMGIALFTDRKIALLSTATYLTEGFIGFPVFAGFEAGASVFAGTTAGYLFGFLALSYICSTNKVFFSNIFLNTVTITLMGLTCMYALGIGYLSLLIGFNNAIAYGLAPFILGALCKMILVALAKSSYARFCNDIS